MTFVRSTPGGALTATLVATLVLAACSAGDDQKPSNAIGERSGAGGDTAQVRLAARAATAMVAAGKTEGERALQVSRALFGASPVLVLAAEDNPGAQGRAARVAEDLGVPLLLSPSSTTSTASPASPATSAALGREIIRLHATTLVTFGADAQRWAGEIRGVRIVADPGDPRLPTVRRGVRPEGLVALTRSGQADVAATTTARAAGARIVPVSGPDLRRDHTAIVALAVAPVGSVVAIGASFGPAASLRRRVDVAATGLELPGGGQVLLPGRRLIALYGFPTARSLGSLGEQPVPASIRRAKRLAGDYAKVSPVPTLPAFELIATVASGGAGSDRNYSNEHKVTELRPWVEAAGKAGVYVVLDLQPGRADFLTQAKRYESLLVLPHVGLGLDPEWRLTKTQVHGRQVGTVTAREINLTTTWLADLTARHKLPQKLVVVHQFRLPMISQRQTLDGSRDELAILIQMDGFGPPGSKLATWHAVLANPPSGLSFGWKNFFDEDKPTFTPARTVRLKPSPVFVSYQ